MPARRAAPPPDRARDLQVLADVLIPGDEQFPPASAAGAHGLLAERLRERLGVAAVDSVLDRLLAATDGRLLAELPHDARVVAVHRFEQDNPDLFAVVRSLLYFSYYQSPLVIAAIRALGIAYNDAPQPHGYLMDPFDPSPGKDAPAAPRGRYIPTLEVTRLDTLPGAARASQRPR